MTNSDSRDKQSASSPLPPVNGVFILVDAAQFPVIWSALDNRFCRLQWLSLCEDPDQAQCGPVLIHVSHDQTRTLAWFLENTHGLHCMSWIVASLGLIDLREHLRSLLQIESHDGTTSTVRYCDTRVLPVWYQTLTPEQEGHALGPINSWTYMNREGMPCTIFGLGKTDAPPLQTFKLCQEQETILLNAALPDLVLQQLEQSHHPELEAMPLGERYRFVCGQLEKAKRQYGMLSVDELAMFCSLALGFSQELDASGEGWDAAPPYCGDAPSSMGHAGFSC